MSTSKKDASFPPFSQLQHHLYGGLLHSLNQYLRHLGTREFAWWDLTIAQQLADLGAAQNDMLLTIVRACLAGCHGITDTTEEGMVEEHGCNPQLGGIKIGKDRMGIIGAIVVPH